MLKEIEETIREFLDTYEDKETVGKLKEDIDALAMDLLETVQERVAKIMQP